MACIRDRVVAGGFHYYLYLRECVLAETQTAAAAAAIYDNVDKIHILLTYDSCPSMIVTIVMWLLVLSYYNPPEEKSFHSIQFSPSSRV
ncbi:hypothetical protein ASPBRDRAFT_39105 [Aspergillus brasiliensis CBS 101740]|uniref:Uncharacterized protein n=1 Tax=Aspergillus brasiliensis (strain CBS 101740 / IMI 381727 / IBT 21946) TaxID=767769 RepID=A0A1L9UY68_ASPBC|nr:hypothetical protein ASPBRDRAFT_39105 [Aspergillus brasiliensis CBS 101740]